MSDSPAKKLKLMMDRGEEERIGVESMDDTQRQALVDWGLRMYGLGRSIVGEIDNVKYDGRLIVLDDGSRWEVEPGDEMTAGLWSPGDRVVIIEGEMYRLEESERIEVREED